jgi:CRISPR-associated exonuclease Cas4
MYREDELVPISALQHYVFCKRQCALIHNERIWQENRYTAEGRVMHEKAHSNTTEALGPVRIARGLPLRSMALGVTGVADVVEFHVQPDENVRVYPIEYKRGMPKRNNCDRIQLCVQAVCLEEMLVTVIPEGAIFYGKKRRREIVSLDVALRNEAECACESVRQLLASGETPPPELGPKCKSCSLREACLPEAASKGVLRYLTHYLQEI